MARRIPVVMAAGLVVSLGMASAASAAPAPTNFKTMKGVCGKLVNDPLAPAGTTYVLQNDLGPCNSDGLRIKGNNITVDLNGHSIKGMPLIPDGPDPGTDADGGFGEGVGIRMVGNKGVTITNSKAAPSTISDFDGGLVIQGGSGTSIQPATGNVVKNIQFVGNVGSQPFQGSGGCGVTDPDAICDFSDFNDGLSLIHADSNTIGPNNLFKANGSGGVRIDDTATGNTITGNIAESNGGNGIRFLTNATGNLVQGNTSRYNAFNGVSISFNSPGNTIRSNTIHKNRFSGIGTSFQAESTMIALNTITDNGGGGIALGSGQNTLDSNTITNNGRGYAGSGPVNPVAAFGTSRGNGINVGSGTDNFPRVGTIVKNNTVTGSGGNGIRINCISDQDPNNFAIYGCIGGYDTHDSVTNNTASGNLVNVAAALKGTKVKSGVQLIGWYDLLDSTNVDATLTPFAPMSTPSLDNPQVAYAGLPMSDCGNNIWSGNTYTYAYPACTTAP